MAMIKEMDPKLKETEKINEFMYDLRFDSNFIRKLLCFYLKKPFYKIRLFKMKSRAQRMMKWKEL